MGDACSSKNGLMILGMRNQLYAGEEGGVAPVVGSTPPDELAMRIIPAVQGVKGELQSEFKAGLDGFVR